MYPVEPLYLNYGVGPCTLKKGDVVLLLIRIYATVVVQGEGFALEIADEIR